MSTPPPYSVQFAVIGESAPYDIRLDWTNTVQYDKIIIAWGLGNTEDAPCPNSYQLDGDAKTYTISGFQPGSTWVVKMAGQFEGLFGGWTYSDWTAKVLTLRGYPQLLFYQQNTGLAFTAAIVSSTQIGGPNLIQQLEPPWDPKWTQLVPLALGDQRFLLWYKQQDGSVWMAPLGNAGNGLSSVATPVRSLDLENKPLDWGNGWTHVVPVSSFEEPYVLLYAPPDNSRQGGGRNAFVSAPIRSPTQIGNQTVATLGKGVQDQDWSQIVPFGFDGDQFLLFYNRATGNAYTASVKLLPTYDRRPDNYDRRPDTNRDVGNDLGSDDRVYHCEQFFPGVVQA